MGQVIIDLGPPADDISARRGLAADLMHAAAGRPPDVAAVLGQLATSARGSGPLTADAAALGPAARSAVSAALDDAVMAARADGGDITLICRAMVGWQSWCRRNPAIAPPENPGPDTAGT
jgi:hypothetical protein